MAYNFETIKILIPIKLDQSSVSDGTVILKWKPFAKMEIVGLGFLVTENFGSSNATVALEINDVEKITVTIPGGTANGKEIAEIVEDTVLEVSKNDTVEFIAKDVNSEQGEGYFVLYYREIP